MSVGIAEAFAVKSMSTALIFIISTDDILELLQVVFVSVEDAVGQQTRSFRSGPTENSLRVRTSPDCHLQPVVS